MFNSVIIGRGDDSALEGAEYPCLLVLMDGEEAVANNPKLTQTRASNRDDIAQVMIRNFAGHLAAVELAKCDFRFKHPVKDEAARDALLDEMWRVTKNLPGCWGNDITDCAQGIVNILKNARVLLNCPTLTQVERLSVPAIAIGAGPSLRAALPALRSLRGKALFVACDAAMNLLEAEGIHPEVCTPLERLPATAQKLLGKYPKTLYAGTPVVPSAALDGFPRKLLVPPMDVLYEWACPTAPMINTGSSSGSMAVMVASVLTDGDVYLVGHDLCKSDGASHADVSSISAKVQSCDQSKAMGYDGKMHDSTIAWERTRIDIQDMNYKRKVFNASGYEKLGSVIQGVECKPLPDPSGLPDIGELVIKESPETRYSDFLTYAHKLPEDFRQYALAISNATDLSDLSCKKHIKSRNHFVIDYIVRSIYAQMSVERRLGHDDGMLILAFQTAVANVYKELADVLRRACESLVD